MKGKHRRSRFHPPSLIQVKTFPLFSETDRGEGGGQRGTRATNDVRTVGWLAERRIPPSRW